MDNNEHTFLLYGAYGYTGRLIAEQAAAFGLRPILAGRDEAKLKAMSEALGFPYLAFDLHDTQALIHALQTVPVVLHAAGPFIHTAIPVIEACLETKTHYLDITGEIAVFEIAHRYGEAAEQNEIMLLPGTGFDVVPTDCVAKFLAEQLPDATHLELAFSMRGGGVSHGTAKTMIEGLGKGGAIRENGRIKLVPLAYSHKSVPFVEGKPPALVMSIPWGDVSTAYYTTGIPNIITYTRASAKTIRMLRFSRHINWLLKKRWLRKLLLRRVEKRPAGPSDNARTAASSYVWGQATNANGQTVSARLQCKEGYNLTAEMSLRICRKVLDGDYSIGYQTPAGAYGHELILESEGATLNLC